MTTSRKLWNLIQQDKARYEQLAEELCERMSEGNCSPAISQRWEYLEAFIDGMSKAMMIISMEERKSKK